MKNSGEKRPLWFVMLVFMSVLPIMVWFVAFQRIEPGDNGMVKFILTLFPFYVFAVLGLSYYVYPERREVSWVLMALTWLSYAALLAWALVGVVA